MPKKSAASPLVVNFGRRIVGIILVAAACAKTTHLSDISLKIEMISQIPHWVSVATITMVLAFEFSLGVGIDAGIATYVACMSDMQDAGLL